MIDEAFDTELEARLRATLDEMIPKLVATAPVVHEPGVHGDADAIVSRGAAPVGGSRRLIGVVLAVAATILGLILIAERDTDRVTPGDESPATDTGPPPWYDLIHASLPEHFPYVALTLATDTQLWFVALSPTDGKALEIQLASGGYSVQPTTAVDSTGEWVETAQGWSVKTPSGLFVNVSCDIGVRGRDFPGPPNYCDMTSTGAFTKTEIRSVVNALATSLTTSIFEQPFGPPTGDNINAAAATALIAAAVPGQQQISDTDWGQGESDHVYDFASDPSRPDTSVRILHDIYPSPPVTGEPGAAAYEDAAVVWMFGLGGVAVRISTTDPSPASVTRLEQLAHDLLNLDPKTKAGPTAAVVATTTTLEPQAEVGTLADDTTTTLAPCEQSSSTAVVVNASHTNETAKWWKELLAANVPNVDFAEPMNAITQEPASRVLALAGSECEASLVRRLTTAATVEPATIETLQSFVADPLPVGTSIVVIVGDDIMAKFTTGVTTTSYG
jgi:hypothetical protein